MSEAVRLGEVLPVVLADIESKMINAQYLLQLERKRLYSMLVQV